MVGNNLGEFILHVVGIDRLATESSKDFGCVIELPTLDVPARRLRQEGNTTAEDQSPEHLKANGDTVRSGVPTVLSAVVNASCKEQANGDGELVARDNGTANLAGGALRHVQDNDG